MSTEEKPLTGHARDIAPLENPIFSALSLNPRDWALFLDIDGTLLDLAETPDGIVVPPDLSSDLQKLSDNMGGALALVTGRSVEFADRLFVPCHFPIAGLHGAERRLSDGKIIRLEPSFAFEQLKLDLADSAKAMPGVIVEDKGLAVAAHFRLAPEHQEAVETMMAEALEAAGAGFALQRGKMVVEIRPSGADKGKAVEDFMATPPFSGRQLMVVGDDLTDEAMFKVANTVGGMAVRVGPLTPASAARFSVASPTALRTILGLIAP